jgi:putative transposase
MRKSRFTEEQMRLGRRSRNSAARTAAHATLYRWKSRYGDMQISELRRLKDLETENAELKRLLAETSLDNAGLNGLLAKSS